MAITQTTLAGAKAANDTSIRVASASGFLKGYLIRIDGEYFKQSADAVGTTIPVLNGQEGQAQTAHASGAQVFVGLASDFPAPSVGQDIANPYAKSTAGDVTYSAAGAIALPTTANSITFVRLLAGSGAAMTLASPGTDIEGAEMVLMAFDAQAYTVTCTAGFGGGTTSRDVATFAGVAGNNFRIRACNGQWNVLYLTSVTLG